MFISVQICQIYSQNSTCNLQKRSNREKKILEKLLALNISKHFTVKDDEHVYDIGICSKATNDSAADVGVLQKNIKTTKTFIIGRLDDVDIEGSDQYIRIQYKNGDKYANACNKTSRTTVITIMCNSNNKEEISLVEENNERDGDDCAYYFILLTPEMCTKMNQTTSAPTTVPITTTIKPTAAPTTTIKSATTTTSINQSTSSKPANNSTASQQTSEAQNATTSSSKPNTSSKFGFFSITIFILLGLLFGYFAIGTLYRRFVNQSRGIEQLPHWQIFHTLGIKFQDCGQFLCHCGKKPSEIRSYEHINDQLSDDENLLNM